MRARCELGALHQARRGSCLVITSLTVPGRSCWTVPTWIITPAAPLWPVQQKSSGRPTFGPNAFPSTSAWRSDLG